MDSSDIKQIIIAYYAIENACDAILKPIRIELGDSETVAKMPTETWDTLGWIEVYCERIQGILKRMDYISDLEKDVDADEELAEAGEMISDILFDVQPLELLPTKMEDIAKAAGLLK